MRLFHGKLVGTNDLPEHFRMLVSGPSGSGKTQFVANLIRSKRIKKPIKHIYYSYPDHFDKPPVDWDTWDDIIVTYIPFLPDITFFRTMEPHSILVLDDNFDNAIKSPAISQAMKIHSRRKFSVILITQFFFEQGSYSRIIRNQLNAVVLYRNFADCTINRRVASQLGVLGQFLQAEKETESRKFDPIVILSHEIVKTPEMRVQSYYLSDNYSYCYK